MRTSNFLTFLKAAFVTPKGRSPIGTAASLEEVRLGVGGGLGTRKCVSSEKNDAANVSANSDEMSTY